MIPANLTEPGSIATELTSIQAYLEADLSADVPADVMERAGKLGQYLARSGKIWADAEYHYNQAVESALMQALKKAYEEKLSPSTINKYVEAMARDSRYLLRWAERVNRTCTHQLDAIRSVISSLKEEMRQINFQK